MVPLLAALFVLAHALAIWLGADAPKASYPFLITAPLLAATACARRARREGRDAALAWWALAMGLLLWAGGMAMSMLDDVGAGGDLAGAGSLLLYVLYGVPLTFALASAGDDSWHLRAIDAALAAMLGGLYFAHTYALASDPGAAERNFLALRLMLDLENLFIAVFAVLRYASSTTAAMRRYFGALSLYACAYLLVAVVINHFFADLPFGTHTDLIIDLPFLALAVIALARVPGSTEVPATARLNHVVRAGSPLVLPIAIVLMSALVVRARVPLGVAGFVVATLGSGLRGVLLQVRAYEERDHFDELSRIDELTGIPNRRQFDDAMQREWRRAQRARASLAVLLIDVDHFKVLNDTHGHPAGDRILQTVARALAGAATRSSDTVARYGGEEFAVLLPSITLDGARGVAEQMRRSVEALALPSPGPGGRVTVSVGVGFAAHTGIGTPAALIAQADEALYQAKAAGRNRVVAKDAPASA